MEKLLLAAVLSAMSLAPQIASAQSQTSAFQKSLTDFIQSQGKSADSARLAQLFDLYWKYNMEENPEWATYIGYPGLNDKWGDRSLAAIERRKKENLSIMEAVNSITKEKLSENDRLNYDLFKDRTALDIEGAEFPGELMPISQMGGVQQDIAQMLTITPANSAKDYRDILSRLKAVPALVGQVKALLEGGLKEGVTPPQVTLRDVSQQVRNQIVKEAAEAPVLVAFKEFPNSIPTAEQEKLRKEAHSIYSREIVPVFEELASYLEKIYIPGCRQGIGLSELPNGKKWYAYLVKSYTTTSMTPEEIFNVGESEVKRIRTEMEKVIKETGFNGDFATFSEFLRTDPQFYFTKPDDLLQAYRDICKRADPELIKLFGHLPRLPYGIKPVPAYAEKSQTTAYYEPGSLKAGRPGYYFANTYDLKSRPKWEMEALSLHEAVPGHHLQTAIAQELEDLPEFRRWGWYTAYGEGWGLYSEGLGYDMGFYEDPYSKFGQLTYEMWRAIRLVVDVGMHWKGWSRQQAIDYFTQNIGKAEHDIVVEVDRYIVWPGQALAYKIGQLKIKELRETAQKDLGEKFDIRAFHDIVLGSGPVPLNILEEMVKEWVQKTKNSKT
ncbi:MAG TPA: DUF885 domain-containing protein [candidate division Zixibacteria bacterium]|nr:DUF885 domain-containing protein [candidate division Zixibacteria bacterium]